MTIKACSNNCLLHRGVYYDICVRCGQRFPINPEPDSAAQLVMTGARLVAATQARRPPPSLTDRAVDAAEDAWDTALDWMSTFADKRSAS